jgi:hypothetical protein
MHDDLATNKGYRYSIATLVFFVTYTIFQPPATVVTYKIGPRIFLPTLCVAWGLVMVRKDTCVCSDLTDTIVQIGFGFVNDWIALIPLRLVLGFFEAGYFPGKFDVGQVTKTSELTIGRMRIPPLNLLRPLRHAKAIRFLLLDRHIMQRIVRSVGLRDPANGKHCDKVYGFSMVADKNCRLAQQATTAGDGSSFLKES